MCIVADETLVTVNCFVMQAVALGCARLAVFFHAASKRIHLKLGLGPGDEGSGVSAQGIASSMPDPHAQLLKAHVLLLEAGYAALRNGPFPAGLPMEAAALLQGVNDPDSKGSF